MRMHANSESLLRLMDVASDRRDAQRSCRIVDDHETRADLDLPRSGWVRIARAVSRGQRRRPLVPTWCRQPRQLRATGALASLSIEDLGLAATTVGIALTSQQLASAAQWVARAASSTEDVHPGPGIAVLSRRGAAVQLITPGDAVDSNQAVIVVLVHGKFDGSVFDHPPGVTVPGGDEMLASFDANTGHVEDFTLLDTAHGRPAPNLWTLGPVRNLPAS